MIRWSGFIVIALTSIAIVENPKLWQRVDRGMYDIILASLKALLGSQSWFWLKTAKTPSNKFCHQFRCIAINKAHLIWAWWDFKEEYRMIGYLKDVFLNILTLISFATITPNVLEYIRVSLKLSPPSHIYRQPLDQLNLIYMVAPIRKPRFEDLAFTIISGGAVGNIPKTMIFVDSIDEAVAMTKFLPSRLPEHIKDIGRVDQIIRIFSVNLTTYTRT